MLLASHSFCILTRDIYVLDIPDINWRVARWFGASLVVGGPGFGSLAESDQETLKVGIRSFSAWRSAFGGLVWGRADRFAVVSLVEHLAGLPFPLSGLTGGDGWQLNSGTGGSLRCLLVKVP